MNRRIFATFRLDGERRTGIVLKPNKKTILCRVVTFRDSLIQNSVIPDAKPIKRHIVKDDVKIYPAGIIPHY